MNNSPNNRVLVIDDNRHIHDDFRKILCAQDKHQAVDQLESEFFGIEPTQPPESVFQVDSAYQGEEGVLAFGAALEIGQPYAVVFVDVRMPPGIDGVETAERLWKLDPNTQIVICTAYSDYSWQEMMCRLKQPDRLLVLKKPFATIEALQMACALSSKWSLERQARNYLSDTERAVDERTHELRSTKERLEAEMYEHRETQQFLLRAQRLECIGTLAGGIAHDLNNLISPITLSAQMLHGDLPPALREELISVVENCAGRAAGVIKQVLTFARGIEGERVALQLGFLVAEVKEITSETFPRAIAVRSRVEGKLMLVEGDATQLHQVLMNLCVNARDAMPKGGTLTISASNFEVDDSYSSMTPEAHPGPHVRLSVSDTGMGIPPGDIERIFDPFFTTKPIGKGSGLGLSSVAGIVKSHGGFLEVRSKPGKGTTFDIFLPASAAEFSGHPEETDETDSLNGDGELILVVDDEKDVRTVTQATLKQHGYRAIVAADGAEAISIYAKQSNEIGAVLTDLLMPIVDGAALCRAMRKINQTGRILVFTGEGESPQFAEVSSLRIDQVLNKPFTTRTLLSALKRVLA